MNPSWTDDPARPLYLQIAHRLRALAAGLEVGERLPSENELAQELAVSRFTVARALEELARDGLVVRRQGAGTFVAPPALKRSAGAMQSFTRAVRASGHESASRLLGFGPVPWRHGLPFDRSESLVAVQRLRLVDGAPGAWHAATLPASVAAAIGLDAELAAAAELSLYE
ncbi:MAG: GntR family transcriptional regulator, partial [Burkholderiales bacterium]|nr:GntR family transcriptional regulator [Burkholderiales bacterium]